MANEQTPLLKKADVKGKQKLQERSVDDFFKWIPVEMWTYIISFLQHNGELSPRSLRAVSTQFKNLVEQTPNLFHYAPMLALRLSNLKGNSYKTVRKQTMLILNSIAENPTDNQIEKAALFNRIPQIEQSIKS